MDKNQKQAIIIGAGPAGLTAAFELLRDTNIKPIVLEKSNAIGGISRTVRFNGNRMDIGGHRFFSKSDIIIDWWLNVLPLENKTEVQDITYQNFKKTLSEDHTKKTGGDMLIRNRKSRILYNKNFFDYPISLSFETLKKLGFLKICKIGLSYLLIKISPIKHEKNLEDFFINRFGKELYNTFFKSYTEKVWGKKCIEIGADWGRQRVKGLSVSKTVFDACIRVFRKNDFRQKNTETSLIEYFMYPKYGPGHLWETVAQKIQEKGGEIIMNAEVNELTLVSKNIISVSYADKDKNKKIQLDSDYVISTMPIDELFKSMTSEVIDIDIKKIATSLEYRNFITIGILIPVGHLKDIKDNWIYIHEPGVYVGRIQFFHNWSEYMVQDKDKHLIGLEFFCNENDELWNMSSDELKNLAYRELVQIGLLDSHEHILDFHVEKVEKTYPVYSGSYNQFDKIKEYLNSIENFFPIGRNGMHRYNNQDHSMLTAIESVRAIRGDFDKKNIWNINAEEEYHEQK